MRSWRLSPFLRILSRIHGVLIVAALTGCDNVNFGGAEFAIVPPPKVSGTPATSGEDVEERLPEGPVLYYLANTTAGPLLTPVAEIAGDSLIPMRARKDVKAYSQRLIAEHMRQGAEFALYRNGSRMGTFLIASATPPEPNVCPALPRATGTMELAAGAEQIPEFLAIAKRYAPEIHRRAGAALEVSRTMQVIAPILAEKMIRARRAELPGNWQRAMAQLKPFPVAGDADAAFAATFLVGDTLGRGADNDGYSLFFIGIPAQMSFDTAFVHFTDYTTAGKAAPRIVDFLDWNRDEQPELLLQVFGISDSWFEVIGRDARGRWQRVFKDRCPQGATSTPVVADSTTTTGN